MATKWFGINSLKRLLQKIDDRYITKTDAQTKLNTKVDKVSGKALSDQNYTKFEKDKLDTIESYAQVNVLEQVKINGKEQTITDKAVDIFVPTDDSQIANSADYQNGKQVAASIKVETDARTSADNILQSNIDSETASRLNADENLQSNIEAETSNRIAGDDALTTNLGDEVARAKGAESTLTTGQNTLTKNLEDHVSSKSNPHSVTKAQVGLGNVANFDQSKAIKSITRSGTTFTATSLDGTTTTFTQQNNDTTYSEATSSSTGLMSASDKAKLDGIASGANKYTHPGYTAHSSGLYKVTVDSTGHVSSVASVAKSDITALGIPGQDTNTTYSDATTSSHGLMSAADKVALDSMKNLQVGGTNLLVGTSRYRKDTPYSISGSTLDYYVLVFDGKCIMSKQPLKAGEIISIQAKSNLPWSAIHGGPAGTAGFWIYYGTLSTLNAGNASSYSFYPGDGQSTEFKKTVAVPSIEGIDDIYMMFRFNIYSDGSTPVTGKFWNLKVERGTIATDWSPAPEDYEATVKSYTLSASGWSSGNYTIYDGLITSSSNQEVLPAVGITSAQYNALSKAMIVDGGQSSGSLTIKALGTVPTIDIPIRIIFRGTI